MTIRTTCSLGALLVASACATSTPTVHAEASDRVRDLIHAIEGFHTWYLDGGIVYQVDAEAEVITLDAKEGRLHWDGADLWYTPKEGAPTRLPAAWSQRVRDVWEEWRAGFPRTTFVETDPSDLGRDFTLLRGESHRWYRVDLPFTWDDPYLVLLTTAGANGGSLAVWDPAAGHFLRVGAHELRIVPVLDVARAERDVPLSPETYAPDWPTFVPQSRMGPPGGCLGEIRPQAPPAYPAWHDLQQYVAFEPVRGKDGWSPNVHLTCPKKGVSESMHADLVWRFPDDPERAALARLAAQDCPDARFFFRVRGLHSPEARQKSCFSGDWSLVDTKAQPEPMTLLTRHVERCRTGPLHEWLPLEVSLPLPVGLDPTGLEVHLTTDASMTCLGVQPEEGVSALVVQREEGDFPVFRWPGCYPGWEP